MIENLLAALASSTPALRERYLQRVRTVAIPEARELEVRLALMVEEDQKQAA